MVLASSEMTLTTHSVGSCDVRVWSAGDGRPLVFLHGFEQHPGAAGFLVRLAACRRVLAPEHPGYGESTDTEDLHDMFDLVVHYRRLISSLADEPVDLIGHSLGGMIAAELAATCPQVVRRLVLVNSYGLWLDDLAAADPFFMASRELKTAKWHDARSAPDPEPVLATGGDGDPLSSSIGRAQNLAVATRLLWPIPDRGLRRRIDAIEAPTLVIHGESDGLLPIAYAEEFARLIPGATLAMIPEAGHLPMIEREDEFVTVTEEFLNGGKSD